MADVLSTVEDVVALEISLQESDDDVALVRDVNGRSWMLHTMPCDEVWAFTYCYLGQPTSSARQPAQELPLPLVVVHRPEPHDSGLEPRD